MTDTVHIWKRVAVVSAAVLLLVVLGGAGWLLAEERRTSDLLPMGSTVGGVDVSGLSRAAARMLLDQRLAVPLRGTVAVSCGDASATLDASRFVSLDVGALVARAYAPKAKAGVVARMIDTLTGARTGISVDASPSVDASALAAWVDDLAKRTDRAARDATLTLSGTTLSLVAARDGRALDRAQAMATLSRTLLAGETTATLPIETVAPKTATSDLGPAIVVRRSQRKLYLYVHGVLSRTYGVAVGTPGHPTPLGHWRIVQKRYLPTWYNPGSEWAKDMPATIAPGPSNPLGTRALNLDVSGIRIHGTTKDSSIGTAASHGCMRMHRADIEDLFGRVTVGTPVYIID